MESTVAALLFVTATVVLSCVAITYSVQMMQDTVTQKSPIMERASGILNETTNLLNGLADPATGYNETSPTPAPSITP